jgi:hypothetical protein
MGKTLASNRNRNYDKPHKLYFVGKINKIIKLLLVHLLSTFATKRRGVYIMLIIPIKDGENIDRALKTLQRKFDKTGTFVN